MTLRALALGVAMTAGLSIPAGEVDGKCLPEVAACR